MSCNPGGRPKVITEAYKRRLGTPFNAESPTGAEVVAQAMFIQTAKGNVSAPPELREATETGTAPDGNMAFPRISQIILSRAMIGVTGKAHPAVTPWIQVMRCMSMRPRASEPYRLCIDPG